MEIEKRGKHFYLGMFLLVLALFGMLYLSNIDRSSITGFVVYSSFGDANLSAWTSVENSAIYANENITFWANYTNNSVFVSGASCNVSFNATLNFTMAEGSGNYSFEINFSDGYNFGAGTHDYNISCLNSSIPWLNVTGNFTIVDPADIALSNLANISTLTTAQITFNLNVPGNVSINYSSNSSSLRNIATDPNFYIYHGIILTGLNHTSRYYFNVTVCNSTNFCNETGPYELNTSDKSPAISGLSDSLDGLNWNVVLFDTDEVANSSIFYGENESVLGNYSNNDSFTLSHYHNLTGLEEYTRYYYNVTVCDTKGNCHIESDDFRTEEESDDDDDDSGDSGGGGGASDSDDDEDEEESEISWIKEASGDENTLDLSVNISNWEDESVNVGNSKGTAITKVTLSAEGSILGNLEVSEVVDEGFCDLSNFDNYHLYRTLLFEHDFPNENISYVEIEFEIDPTWIGDNQIDDMFVYRCEDGEALEMTLESLKDSIYGVRASGFSTWMILGVEKQQIVSSGGRFAFISNMSRTQKILVGSGIGAVILIGAGLFAFFTLKNKGIIGGKKERLLKKGEKMRSEKIDQIAKGKIAPSGTKVVAPQVVDPDRVNLLTIKHPSLRKYVKECLDLGLRKDQILEELRRSGWPESYLNF